MLEVCGLTKRYAGIPAVDNVSFTIRPGQILGYLGPNGSGKSTTVKMLTGMLEPSQGHILFEGRRIDADPIAYKRRLGYVPEEPHLYGHLTGREYLQLVGRLRGIGPAALDRRIDRFLQLFDLYEHRFTSISSYSKGMRQKILLTAALLHNPDLLLFDEPFSGLDVTAAMVFRRVLHELAREGKMVLYSSHVLEVVERLCSEVLILHQGKVVAHDSVERLRSLMSLPSLEEVFAQLVSEQDTDSIAVAIVDAMKA
jgi:ABC-2 type transport system ATP-binding protein